ncbi:Dihydroorotate oxidase [Cladobotryum mycophilum]|uniref:Dihydroorotate oxidase n=1 Tax=Cladobotryum mycophilum TaxID=491253 RepID=A0ABR0S7G8_9HYPO
MSASLLRSRLVASGIRSAPRPRTTSTHFLAANRRLASSSSSGAASSQFGGAKIALYSGVLATSLYLGYLYATDTRAFVHQYVVPRVIRGLFPDAEDAHHAGTVALKQLYELGLHPRERGSLHDASQLSASVFDHQLTNPIGISAGLDKDGEIPDALFALGAGIVEIGGCTPLPQEGNPKPRVFRVPILDGMVNRYGLNSKGADDMAIRLRNRVRRFARSWGFSEEEVLNGEAEVPAGSLLPGRLLAVQIAKNKETDERDEKAIAKDYVYCARRLARYADVLVVNVSSPNTPGLRDLQATEPLTRLLSAVVAEASQTDRKVRPKVMVKVSPDEDEDAQMEGIVQAVQRSGVDGIIEQKALMEQGGYSGPAMFDRTLDLVGRYRKILDSQPVGKGQGQKVLFATGGITDGEQALKILNAGASVAMVYTGLVYGGAGTVTRIKSEMKDAIQANKS